MEAHWETEAGAAFRIGGWPDEQAEETTWDIEIPYLLSILAFTDPNAEVMGLKDVPVDERPPVAVTHISFQVMIAVGMYMMAVAGAAVGLFFLGGRTLPLHRGLLWALVVASPMGFIAIEAGWMVTEVGRQPWIVYEVMRTADAVTPMPHLAAPFLAFSALYLFLGFVTVGLLKRQVFQTVDEDPTHDAEVAA